MHSFILLAVDSNVFFSNPITVTLVNTVNAKLNKLTEWITANKLFLNLKKRGGDIYAFSNTCRLFQLILYLVTSLWKMFLI